MDFVILDVDDDANVPVILDRLFLAISQALIDVGNGKMTLRSVMKRLYIVGCLEAFF